MSYHSVVHNTFVNGLKEFRRFSAEDDEPGVRNYMFYRDEYDNLINFYEYIGAGEFMYPYEWETTEVESDSYGAVWIFKSMGLKFLVAYNNIVDEDETEYDIPYEEYDAPSPYVYDPEYVPWNDYGQDSYEHYEEECLIGP